MTAASASESAKVFADKRLCFVELREILFRLPEPSVVNAATVTGGFVPEKGMEHLVEENIFDYESRNSPVVQAVAQNDCLMRFIIVAESASAWFGTP